MRGDIHRLRAPRGARGSEQQGTRYAVIVQSDNKPVFCGGALEQGTGIHAPVIARLKTNGALDDTFGNNDSGFFYRHAFVGAPSSDDTCRALAVAPGDKIVGAGNTEQGGKRIFVVRLDNKGKLDTTFGSGGFTQIAFPKDATAQSVHVLPDGRLAAPAGAGTGTRCRSRARAAARQGS